jgi:DNA-binding GntR family transcriptional regulator
MAPLNPRPLYEQLADSIGEEINSGKLAPGQILPSEPYLMGEHGVSRGTVRGHAAATGTRTDRHPAGQGIVRR